jgi:hypothetical protein
MKLSDSVSIHGIPNEVRSRRGGDLPETAEIGRK